MCLLNSIIGRIRDVLVRVEYGINILYLDDAQKLCVSLGIGGIIGIHAESWSESRYEWWYQAPFFVTGIKYHFSRYSISGGWKQDYALFDMFKDGYVVEHTDLRQGGVYLKFCVY